MDISVLQQIFRKAWSIESSTLWTPENPAKGQCGVTSLVAHDLLGGEILKTETPDGWHFYNRIDGARVDFTESQFATPPTYQDIPSSRAEAFADTNEQQYNSLREKVLKELKSLGLIESPPDTKKAPAPHRQGLGA